MKMRYPTLNEQLSLLDCRCGDSPQLELEREGQHVCATVTCLRCGKTTWTHTSRTTEDAIRLAGIDWDWLQ